MMPKTKYTRIESQYFGVANLIQDNFEYLDKLETEKCLLLSVWFEPVNSCTRGGQLDQTSTERYSKLYPAQYVRINRWFMVYATGDSWIKDEFYVCRTWVLHVYKVLVFLSRRHWDGTLLLIQMRSKTLTVDNLIRGGIHWRMEYELGSGPGVLFFFLRIIPSNSSRRRKNNWIGATWVR